MEILHFLCVKGGVHVRPRREHCVALLVDLHHLEEGEHGVPMAEKRDAMRRCAQDLPSRDGARGKKAPALRLGVLRRVRRGFHLVALQDSEGTTGAMVWVEGRVQDLESTGHQPLDEDLVLLRPRCSKNLHGVPWTHERNAPSVKG